MTTRTSIAMLGLTLACAALHPSTAAAQATVTPQAASTAQEPFKITDNSFLVEEAFNQEPGVVQNIFQFRRLRQAQWIGTFTQEWPVPGERHQVSYTIPVSRVPGAWGLSDIALNYRFQAVNTEGGGLACAPRLTIILPTGKAEKGLGNGGTGVEVYAPFSRQVRDVYFHWNVGMTHIVQGDAPDGGKASYTTYHLAGSGIWRARPMVNLMLEALVDFQESPVAAGLTERQTVITLSPGVRGGWNIGESQVILGLAAPVTITSGERSVGVLAYFSYEAPLWHPRKASGG